MGRTPNLPEDWPQPYTTRVSVLTGRTELLYNGELVCTAAQETWAEYMKNVLNGHEVGWPYPEEEEYDDDEQQ